MHRGCGVVPVERPVPQQRPEGGRVEARAAHDAPPGEHGREDLPHDPAHVEERHQVAVDVRWGEVPAQRHGRGGDEHVPQEVGHELLVAGGTGREEDEHLVRVRVGLRRERTTGGAAARRRRPRRRRRQRERARLGRARREADERHADPARGLLRRASSERRSVARFAAAVRYPHDQVGPARPQIGLELPRRAARAQGHARRPVARREYREGELGAVREHERDAVAAAVAEGAQGRPELVQDEGRDAIVGQGGPAVDRRDGRPGRTTRGGGGGGDGGAEGGERWQDGARDVPPDYPSARLEEVPARRQEGDVFVDDDVVVPPLLRGWGSLRGVERRRLFRAGRHDVTAVLFFDNMRGRVVRANEPNLRSLPETRPADART